MDDRGNYVVFCLTIWQFQDVFFSFFGSFCSSSFNLPSILSFSINLEKKASKFEASPYNQFLHHPCKPFEKKNMSPQSLEGFLILLLTYVHHLRIFSVSTPSFETAEQRGCGPFNIKATCPTTHGMLVTIHGTPHKTPRNITMSIHRMEAHADHRIFQAPSYATLFLQIGHAISMIIGPETTCRDKGHFILKKL